LRQEEERLAEEEADDTLVTYDRPDNSNKVTFTRTSKGTWATSKHNESKESNSTPVKPRGRPGRPRDPDFRPGTVKKQPVARTPVKKSPVTRTSGGKLASQPSPSKPVLRRSPRTKEQTNSIATRTRHRSGVGKTPSPSKHKYPTRRKS